MDDSDTSVFDQLMSSVDHPMFVVTANDGVERSGCLVGFATQVSIRPPRFLILISKENHTYGVAMHAPAVVVHVLRAGDRELAERFGALSGDTVDKFEGVAVVEGPARAPVLVGLDWFAGRRLRSFDMGDHVGMLLAPHDGSAARAAEPCFGMQAAEAIEPGHPA